jgi:hypothetical protein
VTGRWPVSPRLPRWPFPPPGVEQAALTVAARRVLLDGISALHEHVQALVLVGAQAIYLRSQSIDLGMATATSDGDISLDPELLRPDPRIEEAMTGAGFTRDIDARQPQPGTWFRTVDVNGSPLPIPVDLLAPETLIVPAGRRGVRLPPHDRSAVRRIPGIEVSVEDHDLMEVHSLEPQIDPRMVSIRVAGPVALMVAKAFKIRDRVKECRRSRNSPGLNSRNSPGCGRGCGSTGSVGRCRVGGPVVGAGAVAGSVAGPVDE